MPVLYCCPNHVHTDIEEQVINLLHFFLNQVDKYSCLPHIVTRNADEIYGTNLKKSLTRSAM